MADLDVQPKKQGSILPWVLLGLGLIILLIFLSHGCNDNHAEDTTVTTIDSATNGAAGATNNAANNIRNWWEDVDFNAPAVSYSEITDKNIDVRGNANYGIYGIGEDILFDTDKSTIRTQAGANLKQIATSISQRYKNGQVRVYGYTDAVGSAGYNKQLAEQRAEAVRNWLVKNGNISESRISIHPVGEGQPEASNSTEAGRQQNRRVEIVAGRQSNGNTGSGAEEGSNSAGAH